MQFAKCIITILRHGKFKDQEVFVDGAGLANVGAISALLGQSPVDVVQVARADPTRFEVVNWATSPDDLATQCWIRALDKHSIKVLKEGSPEEEKEQKNEEKVKKAMLWAEMPPAEENKKDDDEAKDGWRDG